MTDPPEVNSTGFPELNSKRKTLTVSEGLGGWWARIDKPGWFMERGPYRFKWMARLAFPIQRWTW